MAFSTQQNFFHVPFMNENVDYTCETDCAKLKSYDSSIDDRSWARNETKKTQFLTDLVACQLPINEGGESSASGNTKAIPKPKETSSDERNITSKRALLNKLDNLSVGDSLLECANLHLADYQKLMTIKDSLESQLDISNERLKNANEENRKIKEILESKIDPDTTNDFHDKIQKLISAGKLTKNEENEMLQIKHKMENIHKAYEILQAENNYYERLIEKLSLRATIEQIKSDPETSSDITYLQKEVNMLRKECVLLRDIENEFLKIKQNAGRKNLSDQDAENINKIIKERNSLREKCKSLNVLKKTVAEMKNTHKEMEGVNSMLILEMESQTEHIKYLEGEIQKQQKCYENRIHMAEITEQCLKKQLQELKDDLIWYKCKAENADMLQTEISCLRNEVLKRDMALNDYGCQYKQLMGVVDELQALKLQCLQDNHTQTCTNQTDDLAFYTCATLNEIMKELKKRGSIKNESNSEKFAYGFGPGPRDEDVDLKKKDSVKDEYNSEYFAYGLGSGPSDEDVDLRKKDSVKDEYNSEYFAYGMGPGPKESISKEVKPEVDAMCDEAMKRLQELEAENANLLEEKSRLMDLMRESEEKMANMLKKIEYLDEELHKNTEQLRRSYNELSDTKKLVENISSIHLQNQQLVHAVEAINSRDDEKVIDDLRRQLEEEIAKLKKCKLENQGLIELIAERDNDIKVLKDLYNEMQRNINRLEEDNRKLIDDNNSLLKEVEHRNLEQRPEDKVKNLPSGDDHREYLNKDTQTFQDELHNYAYNKQDIGESKRFQAKDKKREKQELKRHELEALDAFVHKNVERLDLNKSGGFEKELRKIMDEFIQECGYCFCRLANPKSKLYSICHKLYHCGINKLTFRQLAFLHKKIYNYADELWPGCLLNMILMEHMEEAQDIFNSLTETTPLQKCCSCKSNLCCNKSEEMLNEKVTKLEKEIELAQEHLSALKLFSTANNSQSDLTEVTDDSTYRAASPVQKISSKQFKNLKSCLLKNSEPYRL